MTDHLLDLARDIDQQDGPQYIDDDEARYEIRVEVYRDGESIDEAEFFADDIADAAADAKRWLGNAVSNEPTEDGTFR